MNPVSRSRLMQALDAANLDQSGLAARVGCTPAAIHQIATGATLRSKFLPDIAEALGVSIPWLREESSDGGPGATLPRPDLPIVKGEDPSTVLVELLPTFAGAGGGGTGDADHGLVAFPRDLVERELRAKPEDMLAVLIEGDSMEPEFRSGDQILVDKRRRSIAQPGAFCLWDGDGYVIKLLEKIYDSDPAKVRVISRNMIYLATERLVDEINVLGRVVWFGRRV